MNIEQIKKHQKAWEKFIEFFVERLGILPDYIYGGTKLLATREDNANELIDGWTEDEYDAFKVNALLTEFFRKHNTFFYIKPSFGLDDKPQDFLLGISRGNDYWKSYHEFNSYEQANDFAIERCFELLEQQLKGE